MNRRSFLEGVLKTTGGIGLGSFLGTGLTMGGNTNLNPVGILEDTLSGFKKLELDNGFKAYICRNFADSTRIELKVKYGAVNEKIPGLAHVLEHVIANCGTGNVSADEANAFWKKMFYKNASTSYSFVNIKGNMLDKYVDDFLRISSGVMFEPEINEDMLVREKRRILREIHQMSCKVDYAVKHKVLEKIVGEGHPYLNNIRGTPELIDSISVEDLKSFHNEGFHPNVSQILVVGNVDDSIEDKIIKYFGSFERKDVKSESIPKTNPVRQPCIINFDANYIKSPSSLFNLLIPTDVRYGSKDYYPLKALKFILADGPDSALSREISDNRGLVYAQGTSFVSHNGHYYMKMRTQTDRDCNELTDAVFDVFAMMKENKIDGEDLKLYKENASYDFDKKLKDGAGFYGMIKDYIFSGISPEEHLENMMQVSIEDVERAARKYLPDKDGAYILAIERGTLV